MRFHISPKMKYGLSIVFILAAMLIASCGRTEKEVQKEIILARIGDVDISLNEFIRRSEMTIRPPYCKGDNNLHKKIILNSLIAEKMLALEAAENELLTENERFQLYIQGRQEQAMREQLLKEEVYDQVNVDESAIQAEFDLAGRDYTVQYFSIYDDSLASVLDRELLNRAGFFEQLHAQLWPEEELAQRQVSWESQESSQIHAALFSQPVSKGAVIGPLRIENGHHILIKVRGWTDELAISDNEQKQRWEAVQNRQTMAQARRDYTEYIVGVMAGKKLEFNAPVFAQMVRIVKPFYTLSPEERNELFLKAAFDRNAENPELQQLAAGITDILEEPFFSIDGKSWTVAEFTDALQRHPLVFRNQGEDAKNFARQYRLAVVDMVRDQYLTEEAYKRGLQNHAAVKRERQIWHDALLAQFEANRYLQENVPGQPDSIQTAIMLEQYLNPYVDQLQAKYSDRIEVDVERFNEIRPTRTDLLALRQNVPFSVLVPAFPQVTTDSKLDYGRRMEK